MPLYLILSYAILAGSVFLGISFAFKKNSAYPNNNYLGISFLILAVYLLNYFLFIKGGLILQYPSMLKVFSPWIYLSGPLFYFFVRNTVGKRYNLSKRDWLHFLPALIILIDWIPIYSLDYSRKLELANLLFINPQRHQELLSGFFNPMFSNGLLTLSFLFYFLVSIWVFYKKRGKLLWNRSAKENLMDWPLIAIIHVGLLVVAIFGRFSSHILYDHEDVSIYFEGLFILAFLSLNIYASLFAKNVYGEDSYEKPASPTLILDEISEQEPEIKKTYSIIKEDDFLILKDKIETLLEEECIFLQAGLSLSSFVDKTGFSEKLVSTVIHEEYHMNFNELVNSYRIKAGIQKMEAGFLESSTIDFLAESIGFNSRFTFYRAFKIHTGTTPKKYLTDTINPVN